MLPSRVTISCDSPGMKTEPYPRPVAPTLRLKACRPKIAPGADSPMRRGLALRRSTRRTTIRPEPGDKSSTAPNRRVITPTGPDRKTWLHSISTQHVSALDDGASTCEPQPRRSGSCRGSLEPDRARRRHLHRHRAVALAQLCSNTCARWCSGPTSPLRSPISLCCH